MSFFGSLFGTDAAADAVKQAQQKNIQQTQQTQAQNNALYQPYVTAGSGATNLQSNLLGLNGTNAQNQAYQNFQFSPNYQVAFDQGLNALDRSALGKYGSLNNGDVLKAVTNYGQQQGTQAYNTYYNQLAGLGQEGLTASNANANSNLSANTAITGANTAIGNAQANADLAGGNILGGILSLGTQLFAPQIRSAATSLGNSFSSALNPVATTGQPIQVSGQGGNTYYW